MGTNTESLQMAQCHDAREYRKEFGSWVGTKGYKWYGHWYRTGPYLAVALGLRTSVAAKRFARTTAGVLAAVATAGLREASPAPRRMPCRAVAVGAHGPVGHSAAGTLRCWVCIQVGEAVCLFVSRSGKLFVCLYPGQGSCLFVCIQVRQAVRR